MTAVDEKAGKTAGLSPEKAKAVNKVLADEKNAPPPTKTVELVDNMRKKRKNERYTTLLMHKPLS
jgi:hypothetical protein